MHLLRNRWVAGENFTWLLSANALYSACQWGIVIVLAKFGTPAQLGEYAFAMALAAPIVLFASGQLRALVASDVQRHWSYDTYLKFRFITLAGALVAVLSAGFLVRRPDSVLVILTVALVQVVESISDTYYGFMQRESRLDRVSHSLLIKGPVSLLTFALAIVLTGNLLIAIMGLLAGRLLVLLLWDCRTSAYIEAASRRSTAVQDMSSTEMTSLLRLAIPLGVISTLGAFNTSIPRYFIEAHQGSVELGIFSAVASLLSIGMLVISALGQSMFVPVARACQTRNRGALRSAITQSTVVAAALGACLIAVAALLGREVLVVLFRAEYSAHADVLVRLMVAGGVAFLASAQGYIITAARHLHTQIPVLVASGAVSAVACFLLVPTSGAKGAADAVLAGALVQLTGSSFILLRVDRSIGELHRGASDV